MERIKVLIVDDSALMRQLLSEVLDADPRLEVVGTAPDPYSAWEKIHILNPDVLTLDVEMPRMDGLTFLRKLMTARPMPVVMVSSLTEAGCDTTLRALELGAVDFVTKPKIDVTAGTVLLADEITSKVAIAASARIRGKRMTERSEPAAPKPQTGLRTTHKILVLGASTGGTEALAEVLSEFPPDAPGTLVVLHMPERFTTSFSQRLDKICRVRVHEAKHGDRVLPGHVLLAPGNFHMELVREGAVYSVKVFTADSVNRHRPSVDVLFESCARHAAGNCAAAILTGMGADGARGLLSLRRAGAYTLAQDEATCVVYGMPREAVALGAAHDVLPLAEIGPRLLARLMDRAGTTPAPFSRT